MQRTFFFILLIFYCEVSLASLCIYGTPKPLIICQASAGKQPISASDASTTYTLIVPSKKTATILVSTEGPSHPYTTLKITLDSPSQSKSYGPICLSPIPQQITGPIPEGCYENLGITYEYKALVQAGIIPFCTQTVIFTLLESETNHP